MEQEAEVEFRIDGGWKYLCGVSAYGAAAFSRYVWETVNVFTFSSNLSSPARYFAQKAFPQKQ